MMTIRRKDPPDPAPRDNAGARGPVSTDGLSRLARLVSQKSRARLITADQLQPGRAGQGESSSTAGLDGLPAGAAVARHDLASVCPGRVLEGQGGLCCYLVERPAAEIDGVQPEVHSEYRRTFTGGGIATTLESLHEAVRPLVESPPEAIAYLDIETCGMAGMPLFLVGLLSWENDSLVLRQFLARDYSEEKAALAHAWEHLDHVSALVTFNGRAFDVPFIEDRTAASGLPPRFLHARHVDLLHEARRRWKRCLPNCRLQTLEHFLCGRMRTGDIPGDQIPAVYHEFVRTRDARQVGIVLQHNALDLVTLAELAVCVLQNRDLY